MPLPPDPLSQTIDAFWESVPPAWHAIRNHLRDLAQDEFDISVEQFHVLRLIHFGASSVSELANVRQISRPAISQLVDGLVEKGLVQRTQSTEDRRYVELALTPSGDQTLTAIFTRNRDWMRAKLSTLHPGELAHLPAAFAALKRAFRG